MSTTEGIVERTATRVQAHHGELRKEMGIADVVLAQITYIITLEFFGGCGSSASEARA